MTCNGESHLGMLVAVRSDDPGAALRVPWRSGPGVGNTGDGRSLRGRLLGARAGDETEGNEWAEAGGVETVDFVCILLVQGRRENWNKREPEICLCQDDVI